MSYRFNSQHFLGTLFLLVFGSGVMNTQASVEMSTPADSHDKHIYVGQYDLSTNLWGIKRVQGSWQESIFTNSPENMKSSGYKWTGFGGNSNDVKAYTSIRMGASNHQNIPAKSGIPYIFGNNSTNIDVLWDFDSSDYEGNGNITGEYNHTLDVFFNSVNNTRQSSIRGEIMIITDSSQDSQTRGWGMKDKYPYVLNGEFWDIWQATQNSNGYRWHVTQFRKRINSKYFHQNLKNFFSEATRRRPDIFKSTDYVMMVESGTEIKTGSGQVLNKNYSVKVN